MAETFQFEGIEDRHLRLWLFRNVKNSSELLKRVQDKTMEPECSFINADLVADVWLVLVAGFKALADERHGKLKTHSLHGELVFNLSGSRHIGESFKQYGLSASVTNVLVGRFDATVEQEQDIMDLIAGELQPLPKLGDCADKALIEKHLHLSGAEKALGDVAGSVVTRMAVRDC